MFARLKGYCTILLASALPPGGAVHFIGCRRKHGAVPAFSATTIGHHNGSPISGTDAKMNRPDEGLPTTCIGIRQNIEG
jgi:hypothetical protein